VTQVIIKAPAHPCLMQHYSQEPSYGKSQDAPQQMNGLRKVVFILNGVFLSHKEE
jgi:hypothetical protein